MGVRIGLVLAAIWAGPTAAVAARLDDFAACLADQGAVVYGAHWCPYCARQRARFGDAWERLRYVECYEPGTRQRREVCAHIGMFPTWVFGDSFTLEGIQSLENLAAVTGCSLP